MTPIARAVGAAVGRLAELAHPGGAWTDFWLEPGASSSWVTGYTAHALAVAARDDRLEPDVRTIALRTAGSAADALVRTAHDGAWGWSPDVRPDADSTAWALRALTATGRPADERSWAFLAAHRTAGGYRTYTAVAAGTWTAPTPDVTAAVLLALHEGGRMTPAELARRWTECFGDVTRWPSHWWPTDHQPGALVLEAWVAAGRPARAAGTHTVPRGTDGLPSAVWAAALRDDDAPFSATVTAQVTALLAAQLPDGGWPGLSVLTVPAAHAGGLPTRARDARGVFTTATALHALLATDPWPPIPADPPRPWSSEGRVGDVSRTARHATARDSRWDALTVAAARSQGCDARLAADVLTELTRESLAARSPWPAEQLSTLAAGLPLELSVGGTPALRVACEVGDPRLPPHRRVRSGAGALGRTAEAFGAGAAWRAAAPVLAVLADPALPVADGNRFGLWAGLDLHPEGDLLLKAYLSLHAGEVPGWRERERAALLAAGVPAGTQVFAALDRLAVDGWCQQIGLGLTPVGLRGLKVYYELTGWRPSLVRDLLALCDLPDTVDALVPEIPGVLRAELAARRRAGISLRVGITGRVDELTVTAAFPPPLVGRDELDRRVLSWLPGTGTDPEPLAALLRVMDPTWIGGSPVARRLGLFTRSLSASRAVTTVYVRPGPAPHRAAGTLGSRMPYALTGR